MWNETLTRATENKNKVKFQTCYKIGSPSKRYRVSFAGNLQVITSKHPKIPQIFICTIVARPHTATTENKKPLHSLKMKGLVF
jgi:hypothetical protein